MRQRQLAVAILALQPRRVQTIRLAPHGFGRLRHLHHIGQQKPHALPQQRLHPCPACRALLNPHDLAATPLDHLFRGLHHLLQAVCGRRHRLHRLLPRELVVATKHAVFVVIVHCQDDILAHGGLLYFLASEGLNPRKPLVVFFRRVYLDLREETALLTHDIFGAMHRSPTG